MARPPRIEVPGGIHHVVAHAVVGRLLFENDVERRVYLACLKAEADARGWKSLAFCLMSNHIHLLVMTPEGDLAEGIQAIHGSFAAYINRCRKQRGHLFDGRYRNRLVITENYYAAVLRYIARNPVKARMCERVEDWPWSGHQELAGLVDPRFVDVHGALGRLGLTHRSYVELVGQSDQEIMRRLIARHRGDAWLIPARDEHDIPVDEIAAFLGVSRRSVFRRLARARDVTQGSDP